MTKTSEGERRRERGEIRGRGKEAIGPERRQGRGGERGTGEEGEAGNQERASRTHIRKGRLISPEISWIERKEGAVSVPA